MATREDIEALHDAYREEERATSDLKWNTENREKIRDQLHQAHGDVVCSEQRINKARAIRMALEAKIGVTT